MSQSRFFLPISFLSIFLPFPLTTSQTLKYLVSISSLHSSPPALHTLYSKYTTTLINLLISIINKILSLPPIPDFSLSLSSSWSFPHARHHHREIQKFLRGEGQRMRIVLGGGLRMQECMRKGREVMIQLCRKDIRLRLSLVVCFFLFFILFFILFFVFGCLFFLLVLLTVSILNIKT